MNKLLRRQRFLSIPLGLLALTILYWCVNTLAYQSLIIERHANGQNRLLDYVIELRNELKNYRILPYALADNATLLAFMEAPYEQNHTRQLLQRHLEDLTHVSKTRDWLILSKQGKLLLSSEQSPNFKLSDYFDDQYLANILQEQQGEPILVSGYNQTLSEAVHLVLAPVYTQKGLSGAVAVRINVSEIIERWSLSGDLVIMTDKNNLVFLANRLNNAFNLNWFEEAKDVEFLNFTRAKTYRYNDENYLLQNVILDDLKWQIHYFSGLKSIEKTAQNVAFTSLGICILIFVFWLYRRERSLKIASKLENEALIAKSAQLQRVLIEKTHVGLLQLTCQGKISFVNPMGMRYFGNQTQLEGQSLHDLLPAREENRAALSFIEQLSHQQIDQNHFLEQEVILQKDNGETFPALLSISSLEWSASQGYLVTLINISKRKLAELRLKEVNSRLEERVLERTLALEKAQKELLRTEKLAAIGQMSTAIAHELNQPLTGIRTLAFTAELLLKREQTEQAIKTLNDLESLVNRMQDLTSELKVLAYRRPEQLSPTSLLDCLNKAIKSLGETTENIQWCHQLNDDIFVMAEPTRLERILANLISNTLQACHERDISPSISMETSTQEGAIQLSYTDNGGGIEKDKLAHLFEPFYTTKPIGKGLGLGLAISANLAKDMNGTLSATLSDNAQLTFKLTLLKA